MSEYLGFEPSRNKIFYFVSYNSEDKEKIAKIAKTMMHNGINLWYDYGIDYGEKWEEIITKKIKESQGVLLFFTKGILNKQESYVQKEYRIAEFLGRKIYVAMVDQIKKEEVPDKKVSWWVDIMEKQTVNLFETNDLSKNIDKLAKLLGVERPEDRTNKALVKYSELFAEGRTEEAEEVLAEYRQGISLKGKAELISNIVKGGFNNAELLSPSISLNRLEHPLQTHTGAKIESFYECRELTINGNRFVIGNGFIFHRWKYGDAHVIWIWKNGELIHTIGSLVEARKLEVYWDSVDNILYVTFLSDCETFEQGELISCKTIFNITTVENPDGMTVCTNFDFAQ